MPLITGPVVLEIVGVGLRSDYALGRHLHGIGEATLVAIGDRVLARLDSPPGPNQHDILTGSRPDGTAFPPGEDRTCNNWSSSGDGRAMVGHHDRMGVSNDEAGRSWNSSHLSAGCSDPGLIKTGGAGKLYCFAVN